MADEGHVHTLELAGAIIHSLSTYRVSQGCWVDLLQSNWTLGFTAGKRILYGQSHYLMLMLKVLVNRDYEICNDGMSDLN